MPCGLGLSISTQPLLLTYHLTKANQEISLCFHIWTGFYSKDNWLFPWETMQYSALNWTFRKVGKEEPFHEFSVSIKIKFSLQLQLQFLLARNIKALFTWNKMTLSKIKNIAQGINLLLSFKTYYHNRDGEWMKLIWSLQNWIFYECELDMQNVKVPHLKNILSVYCRNY